MQLDTYWASCFTLSVWPTWCLRQLNEGHHPLQGGVFAADVLVGDSGITNPIAWRIVSSLAVKHKSLEDGSQPAAPGKLAAYAQFATKPTIVHIQRQPDKRAPPALSLLFAGLTLTPLLVLIWMLGQLGVNFKVSTRYRPPLPDWQCRQWLNLASSCRLSHHQAQQRCVLAASTQELLPSWCCTLCSGSG